MTPLQQAAQHLIDRQTPGWVNTEPTVRSIEALRKALEAEQAQTSLPATHKTTGWAAPVDRYAVPVLFNPYTGDPRDVRDVQSDPQGVLIVPPGKVEILAAKPTAESVTDCMMNLVDRLGHEASDVDARAWEHLLVYAPKQAQAANSRIASLYEELRKATDGGSESMTHDDALKQIAYWQGKDEQAQAVEPLIWVRKDQLNQMASGFLLSAYRSTEGRTDLMPVFTHPAPPADDFDTWQKNPYTLILQKSIAEDYVPKQAQQVAVPMPDEAVSHYVGECSDAYELARAIEAHHGITPQGDKP